MQLTEMGRGKRKWTVIGVVALLVALAWSEQIDRQSRDYVDSAIIQALGAFATARVLNAGITVAKSVQIGAVVSVQPLEILDPLHDLVEQYSSIMKLAIGSLITQKLLLEIAASSIFKVAITFLGLLAVASLFVFQAKFSAFFLRCFAFACLIRFLFVITLVLNALVDTTFVKEKTENELSQLAVVARQVERLEAGSDLSIEQQENLEDTLAGLKLERDDLITSFHRQRMAVEEQARLVQEAGLEIEQFDPRLILVPISILPFLWRRDISPTSDEHRQRLNTLDLSVRELAHIRANLKTIQNRIAEIERILSGESPRQWLSGLTSTVFTFVDLARFDGLRDRLQALVDSILQLMALFVFKTLLMPIIFLLMLLRGYRYIWGIDVRRWLKNVKAELKSEPVASSHA